jgi:hypothetical protein
MPYRLIQGRSAQPCAVERLRTCFPILGIGDDCRERARHCGNRLLGHHGDDRIAVLRVQSFNRVRDGVGARCDRQSRRQGETEIDVINDDLRKHLQRALSDLLAAFGPADDRSHFRTGIGGWNNDLDQIRAERDGFAEPGRGTSSKGNGAVRSAIPCRS